MPALSVPGAGGNGTRLAKEARNTVILPSHGLCKVPMFRFHAASRSLRLPYLAVHDTLRSDTPIWYVVLFRQFRTDRPVGR